MCSSDLSGINDRNAAESLKNKDIYIKKEDGILEALPHVGAVIDSDDVERVQRLLTRLARIVDERSERYSAARTGTLTEYRQISDGAQEPRILLLVDGIGAWREAYERSSDGQNLLDVFTRLLVDGRARVCLSRCQSVPNLANPR